ncbi:alpha/beta hydrolase [Lutimonas sp.]|uniref:alpha/beta hydrolase n=1 Tax=Lutimonas sp. TaxID=1872403 RepID=UPI003D9ABE33
MKHTIVLFISLFFMNTSFGQQGKVFDDVSLKSEILNGERKYAIYLPPDYDTSSRNYPVLYLLHGAGDDQTGWVQFGEVLRITDEAIRNGKATPMIIVMPDANTGQRGYFNDIDGTWNYEDFFFEELMPHVEEKYRIKSEKRYRAVSGLSMGGGGSFMYALHRPDLFSSAVPLSAYAGPLTIEDLKQYIDKDTLAKISQEELQTYFEQHNAVELVKNMDQEKISSVRWYIDCGDDDFLYEGNSLVHIEMKKKEIPHEYRVRDGAHNWTYWRESLPEVLHFVSQAFHQY